MYIKYIAAFSLAIHSGLLLAALKLDYGFSIWFNAVAIFWLAGLLFPIRFTDGTE